MRIPAASLETIRRHAEASRPEECCGILLGEPGAEGPRVAEVVPAGNAAPDDRRARYAIEPTDLLAAAKRARSLGLEIVGYYHSHPRGPAEPSERDGEHAWPEASYLIVGLGHCGGPRSWRLRPGTVEFEEEPLEVVGDR
ncbi:MAG: Mov34/MPN/PAD-1 family protein [Thermoanaerobaculia bacterium]